MLAIALLLPSSLALVRLCDRLVVHLVDSPLPFPCALPGVHSRPLPHGFFGFRLPLLMVEPAPSLHALDFSVAASIARTFVISKPQRLEWQHWSAGFHIIYRASQ